MSIINKLTEELKSAMKAKDKERVNTLRLLVSKLKMARIESGKDLTDDQEMDVLIRAAKERKESIKAYESGGRQDLLEQEKAELDIIEEFLPAQLTDDEIEKVIVDIIEETGATSMKDLGKVMSQAMKTLKGQADGKKVQSMVRTKLA